MYVLCVKGLQRVVVHKTNVPTKYQLPRNLIRSYFLININKAGPCTGSSLVFIHKPAFFSIYSRNSVISYFLISVNEAGPWTGSGLVFNLKPAFL